MALRALVSTATASLSLSLLLASRRTFATTTARYVSLLRYRPLLALSDKILPSTELSSRSGLRCFSTNRTTSSLNDPSPNWSNRPPKETILLDGCDFEHWLVVVEPPDPNFTRDEIIKSYIQSLAKVVGSEEEARFKIYSVSTKHYFAFGALVSEELSYKLKEVAGVRWVLPDSYLDVRNKDYGGEPFINGEAVPYDPKYHEEWVRNNARANERNRRNDRPRNLDRSRNFERRRENMQNFQNRPPPPPPPPPMPGQDQGAQVAQNPMPPRDVPNQSIVPPMSNAMPRDAPNSGYQNQIPNYQSNVPNNQSGGGMSGGGYQGPPGNSPYQGPSNAHQGGPGGYQGSPNAHQGGPGGYQGPPNAYQGGPGGYQGAPNVPGGGPGGYQGAPNVPGGGPPGYQGIPNAGPQVYPATPNSPQGGPGGYQGGPGGYQGPPNAYQGGPGGYQGPRSSYQGGSGNPYPGTPNSPQGPGSYQGGGNSFQETPNTPQGGPGAYQAGGSPFPGRDMPGRDQ